MSTADDAERDGVLTNGTREPYERGYADGRRAGYRRALEDAADEVRKRGDFGPVVSAAHARWLRDRADRVDAEDGGR